MQQPNNQYLDPIEKKIANLENIIKERAKRLENAVDDAYRLLVILAIGMAFNFIAILLK